MLSKIADRAEIENDLNGQNSATRRGDLAAYHTPWTEESLADELPHPSSAVFC